METNIELKLRNHNYPGRLIVFEGTDGAGKTTLINKTKEYLGNQLGEEKIIVTKQPTDMSRKTKLFQKMMFCHEHDDIDYRAVQLLTLSDRLQHGHEEIEPALRLGKTVVCDRYLYTSVANMFARGYTNESWFFEASKNIIKPDLVFLAHVSSELAIQRIKARPEESRRHLDEAQLKKVNAEFLKMSGAAQFIILDTSVDADEPFEIVKAKIAQIDRSMIYTDFYTGAN